MKKNSLILKKLLPSLLSAAMVSGSGTPSFSLNTFAATSEPALSSSVNTPSDAAKATDSDAEYDEDGFLRDGKVKNDKASKSDADKAIYALMNIPYADFYANEMGAVDSITSATLRGKARNVNVNGASYHQSKEAVTSEGIAGVTFPIMFEDFEAFKALNSGEHEVTEDASLSYEMTARGQTSTVTLTGAGVLQESPDYSYYILDEEPANYKVLTVADGKAEFGEVQGEVRKGNKVTGDVTLKATATGHVHADVEISLSGVEADPKEVSAVIVTADGINYALHHVVNIWRGTEIGANKTDIDLEGKTITNVRYYLKDGTVTDYPAKIKVSEPEYVLMNIPYADFYANEMGAVDSITSATLRGKARNVNVNGASYHQSEEAATTEGIRGVTYPVKLNDAADLKTLGGTLVKNSAKLEYEMTARGQTSTVTLTGAGVLQESPDYSYYILDEEPANYKVLTVADGKAEFGEVQGEVRKGNKVTGDVTLKATATGHVHADVEISLSGVEADPKEVSAVIVTADGINYALHHVVNIWRGTEIGANKTDIDLEGKTITNVRYYLKDGTVTDYPASILVKDVPEEEQSSGRSSSGGSDSDSGSSSANTGSSNSSGWKKNNMGWQFRRSDGSWVSNEWLREGSSWYAFDERGYMRIGWYFDAKDRHWYFFDLVTGAMKTGWITVGGKRYFLNTAAAQPTYEQNSEGKWIWKGTDILPLGAMYAGGVTPDGTAVDENGAAAN